MIYDTSPQAVAIFAFFVAVVLGLSFYLGSKAKSAQGYFAAHGQVHWFVNGVAFAGDYLSAASFLGICGMIAFHGYDGFLYSIGYLAGWIVALFVIAEPLKRLGKFTFADALDNRFHSRGIKLTAAISTLVVSTFYLIPQMVGAGALIRPLLGLKAMYGVSPHAIGVICVGAVVILIVVTAGMVSTTWVQFIKGTLLVLFCAGLTVAILRRGLETPAPPEGKSAGFNSREPFAPDLAAQPERYRIVDQTKKGDVVLATTYEDRETGRLIKQVAVSTPAADDKNPKELPSVPLVAQTVTVTGEGQKLVDGLPQGKGDQQAELHAMGHISRLPPDAEGNPVSKTGPLGPLEFFSVLQRSEIVLPSKSKSVGDDGAETTTYAPRIVRGSEVLYPGSSPTFAGVRSDSPLKKLDFLSLMLALFGGTASLPHILIRYYTVKDQASARKSTVVGIASIGFFYILTLYLGLAAMTSGVLDPTDENMSAPLLARSFGPLPFAIISAIAFTTVLGTVSGLIMAAAGAVAHDLASSVMQWQLTDHEKVRIAKLSAVVVGIVAMVLGIWFEKFNVTFLVGWAFNIAASANLPSLIMLLFWKKTTKQGITAAILVGMVSSLGWILLSEKVFVDIYGLPGKDALVPFSQPAIVTIPLGFIVLIVVSLLTQPREPAKNAR